MDPQVASEIVALRPALESLVVRISQEPEQVMDLGEVDKKVTNQSFTFNFIMISVKLIFIF